MNVQNLVVFEIGYVSVFFILVNYKAHAKKSHFITLSSLSDKTIKKSPS